MASLPSSASLTSLCIPGTHESLALYGYPISTCQSSDASVAKQLLDGIRFLDVRLIAKPVGAPPAQQRLLAYHGVTDERMELSSVLDACFRFLDASRGETLIMSVKSEGNARETQECFEAVYLRPTRGRWFLQPRVPTLGEARGKIVLLSRYAPGNEQPGGIHPPIWPNNLKDT